ncbi:Metabotropic glutamate receptor 5 [Lamellibrachia satsuma]|nr:Metabotropic glutamate receptor 5 [Lamellibrachia satsuma]
MSFVSANNDRSNPAKPLSVFLGVSSVINSCDGWAVRPDVVNGLEQEAAGGISIKLYSPPIVGFDRYYFSLRPKTNTHNPWFREFWQQKFKCYIDGPDKDRSFKNPCTGEEDLSKDYVQDAKLGFVVNAIYSMAYALDKMQRHLCAGQKGLCPDMMPLNGTLFLEYLLNVSFSSYSGDVIVFNRNGDPPGRFRKGPRPTRQIESVHVPARQVDSVHVPARQVDSVHVPIRQVDSVHVPTRQIDSVHVPAR